MLLSSKKNIPPGERVRTGGKQSPSLDPGGIKLLCFHRMSRGLTPDSRITLPLRDRLSIIMWIPPRFGMSLALYVEYVAQGFYRT